jgi:hypothetical protein
MAGPAHGVVRDPFVAGVVDEHELSPSSPGLGVLLSAPARIMVA